MPWKSETGFKRDCDTEAVRFPSNTVTISENLRPGLNGIVTALQWKSQNCCPICENLRPGLNGIVTALFSVASCLAFKSGENLRPGLNGIVTILAVLQGEHQFSCENLRPGLNGNVTSLVSEDLGEDFKMVKIWDRV